MRVLRRALVPALLGIASSSLAGAEERVVEPGRRCSDAGPGSAARPWCTLAAAGRRAGPGDRVAIRAGSYREPLRVQVSGAPGKPILFEGEAGRSVLDGSSLTLAGGMVELERRTQIVVRGLTIRAAPAFGILARASSDLRFERNRIETARRAILVESSSRVQLVENRIGSPRPPTAAAEPGIELKATEDFLIAGNLVQGGAGIAVVSGPIRGELRDNEVRGARGSGILLRRARAVKVLRNRLHSGGAGIRLEVGDEEGPSLRESLGNELFQNLVYGNRESGIELRRTGGASLRENRVFNNVLHANLGAGIAVDGALATTIANNILSANKVGLAGATVGGSTISHNLFHANRQGGAQGKAALGGDPRFVSAARGDFRLASGSPAIDAGILMGLPYAGEAPDLGAHERAER